MRLKRHEEKRLLELAMSGMWYSDKRQLRKLFAVLDEGYSVRGYANKLELALKTVQKAKAAINILEAEQ